MRKLKSILDRADSGRSFVSSLAVIGFFLALTQPALPQIDTPLDAVITIVRPININQMNDLEFGEMIPSSTGSSTITVSPNSTVSSSGPGTFLGPFQPASFRISGEPGFGFTIDIPSTALSIVSGLNSMIVDGWASDLGASSNIPQQGFIDLSVGGRLTLGADQAEGLYIGTFSVSVAYE
jgi:hypothetical protein